MEAIRGAPVADACFPCTDRKRRTARARTRLGDDALDMIVGLSTLLGRVRLGRGAGAGDPAERDAAARSSSALSANQSRAEQALA